MSQRHSRAHAARPIALALSISLGGCASNPPPPDWQSNARSAIDAAVAAYLVGDSRFEASEFSRARDQIARTGRLDLLARAELMRCAARVASLVFEPCAGFELLRADAAAEEQAYAALLAGEGLSGEAIGRLPSVQRDSAQAIAAGTPRATAGVQAIDDPLSRLISIAALFRAKLAGPTLVALAIDTASAQGWRRPLLAWLEVQAQLAERAGDAVEAARLRRRIAAVALTR